MKKVLITLCLIILIGVAVNILLNSLYYIVPHPADEFTEVEPPPAPDYSDERFWAALPEREDLADLVPKNTEARDNQKDAEVDVFFIHPTTFLFTHNWNATADDEWAADMVDNGIMPSMASVFNGVGKIYAPRYRQSSIGAQLQSDKPEDMEQSLAIGTSDIIRAFEYFLKHQNNNRPFIIAGHSQGATHGGELLKYLFAEKPETTERLIAAYLLGNTVDRENLDKHLHICNSKTDTGCYLSWNTVLEGGDAGLVTKRGETVCVNPLTWKHDEILAEASLHIGALPMGGSAELKEPYPQLISAQCKDEILWISKPGREEYNIVVLPGDMYHMHDVGLFYMDIRANLKERVQAYFDRHQ